jgi:hypothetical protein
VLWTGLIWLKVGRGNRDNVIEVINFQAPHKSGNVLTNWASVGFSMTLLRAASYSCFLLRSCLVSLTLWTAAPAICNAYLSRRKSAQPGEANMFGSQHNKGWIDTSLTSRMTSVVDRVRISGMIQRQSPVPPSQSLFPLEIKIAGMLLDRNNATSLVIVLTL